MAILLPAQADNQLTGGRVPVYVFGVLAVISFVRSCIHVFAPDGGAGSIAGMDLSVSGASGIIFAFGLWGSAQLIYALVQLAVVTRYRSLVPAMYLLLFVETLLRTKSPTVTRAWPLAMPLRRWPAITTHGWPKCSSPARRWANWRLAQVRI